MKRNTYPKLENEGNFRNWLITEKKLSSKYASDVVSRCKRIQYDFSVDLSNVVKNRKTYSSLFLQLRVYNRQLFKENSDFARVNAPLRRALKLFAEYHIGSDIEDYPTGYDIR